jgi:hypothetical protein
MATVKLYTYNILEDGDVTVTGSPDTGYPEERIFDRARGFYWKRTASATHEIEIDQGGSDDKDVDALIVEGHNFSGLTIQWQYSSNGVDWTTALSWTQADNTKIVKTLAVAVNARYWKLVLNSAVNPQCTEVFMSFGYEFRVRFDDLPAGQDVPNVNWELTYGGFERSDKRGDTRRRRIYSVFHDDSMLVGALADYREAIGYLDEYSKPFYIKDHEGNYWLGRFEAFEESYITEGSAERQMVLLEQL